MIPYQLAEIRRYLTCPVDAGAQQRCGLGPFIVATEKGPGIAEQRLGVGEAAMHAILPEPMADIGGKGAKARQFLIRLIVAGKNGKGNALRSAGCGDLLQAVWPIAPPAEQAEHHQFCLGDDRLDIKIDRHRMGEAQHVGEPERGRLRRPPRLGLRQTAKLRIRR